ncbi:hypothetical protein [Chondromyces crocatus]|uniref:Uncharacterized protein n=1 Tax=Chondromyces crocatus TaxID=52 RepID=A0A0K1ECF5_CHOCO|nr:hypothetical protein [Chondromyces crocatus]AKT38367.1 uncharacterized protein CMC5_025130 [Chondromyces crocatus]
MKLLEQQADVLRETRARQRDVRLAEHLRTHHEDLVASLDGAELLRRVQIGVRRAAAHGITWDSTLAAYLVLMLRVAPNFDEHPIASEVLRADAIEPNLRVDALIASTDDEHWEEIAAQRSDHIWGSATGDLA